MTVGGLRLIYRAFIKIHIIMQQPSKSTRSTWGEDRVIENCCSLPFQMIAQQSYEKEKGPSLINMWEVDFPCKADLQRRKVCVCPLCRPGCACGFVCTWDILDGLRRGGLLTALQVQRDM